MIKRRRGAINTHEPCVPVASANNGGDANVGVRAVPVSLWCDTGVTHSHMLHKGGCSHNRVWTCYRIHASSARPLRRACRTV